MKLPCPRCEFLGGQGSIYRARFPELNIELCICDECEACWTKNQVINGNEFAFLTQFLEKQGLTYENSIMEDLGYLEQN